MGIKWFCKQESNSVSSLRLMLKMTVQLNLLILGVIALRLVQCFTNILDCLVYLTDVSVMQTYHADSRTIDKWWAGRDLVGSSHDVFEEGRRHLLGRLTKKTKAQTSRCVCLYSTKYLPKTNVPCVTAPLGLVAVQSLLDSFGKILSKVAK